MTNYNQLRRTLDLTELATKTGDTYSNCEYINVGSIGTDKILVSFVCYKDFKKTIFVFSIPRVTPAQAETDPVLSKASIDFEIGEYHETMIDSYLFITVTEKTGRTVSVTRFDLNTNDSKFAS